jgi:hypothetical protein
MTLSDAIRTIEITQVWHALGGGPLRHGRGVAFYRGGDGYNVALDDHKGAWHDHRDGHGGGILDLIQRVLDCNRQAAIIWLSEAFSLDLGNPLSAVERRAFAKARAEAERFIGWRDERLREVTAKRNYHLQSYHRNLRLVVQHGLDYPGADKWADAVDEHETAYQTLDQIRDELKAAAPEKLITQFRAETSHPVSAA